MFIQSVKMSYELILRGRATSEATKNAFDKACSIQMSILNRIAKNRQHA